MQIFQQAVSLGPQCCAKWQMREFFKPHHGPRGVFDWQVTPPEAVLDYIRCDFQGTFERNDLYLDGTVKHRRFNTIHLHLLPGDEIDADSFEKIYPAAKRAHEKYCGVTREAIHNPLSTLFVLSRPVPDEFIRELKSCITAINPLKTFTILPAPANDDITRWDGDRDIWREHLAPYQITPPIPISLGNHLWRLRKNIIRLAKRRKSRAQGVPEA
jgi:hypothetical protein